jgi:hypothetical protein
MKRGVEIHGMRWVRYREPERAKDNSVPDRCLESAKPAGRKCCPTDEGEVHEYRCGSYDAKAQMFIAGARADVQSGRVKVLESDAHRALRELVELAGRR